VFTNFNLPSLILTVELERLFEKAWVVMFCSNKFRLSLSSFALSLIALVGYLFEPIVESDLQNSLLIILNII